MTYFHRIFSGWNNDIAFVKVQVGGNRFGYLDLSGNVGVMNALIINLTRQIIELPPGTLASLNNHLWEADNTKQRN